MKEVKIRYSAGCEETQIGYSHIDLKVSGLLMDLRQTLTQWQIAVKVKLELKDCYQLLVKLFFFNKNCIGQSVSLLVTVEFLRMRNRINNDIDTIDTLITDNKVEIVEINNKKLNWYERKTWEENSVLQCNQISKILILT